MLREHAPAGTESRPALVCFHYPARDTVVAPGLVCGEHLLRRQEAFKYRVDEELTTA